MQDIRPTNRLIPVGDRPLVGGFRTSASRLGTDHLSECWTPLVVGDPGWGQTLFRHQKAGWSFTCLLSHWGTDPMVEGWRACRYVHRPDDYRVGERPGGREYRVSSTPRSRCENFRSYRRIANGQNELSPVPGKTYRSVLLTGFVDRAPATKRSKSSLNFSRASFSM